MNQEYKNFFKWLLDKEVELYSEIDVATEKEIYYPKDIKLLIDTKEFQRLKKVLQLSTVIIENDSVYNTRYEHSLGTYNIGTILYLNQYRNDEWRVANSSEEKRLEIIATLVELLTHDMGHLTYSHTLERLIGRKGAHEIITDRIVEERLEPVLSKINPKLPQLLNERRKRHNFGTIKEGNIDFDRMDYLVHDSIYIDEQMPVIQEITQKILEKTSVVSIDGIDVPVLENEIVPDSQVFLQFRANQYEDYYYSNNRNTLDNICNCLCFVLYKEAKEASPEFTNYLQTCILYRTNLDLDKHVNWNDINTINSFIEIAENAEDEKLSKVATCCLPTLNGLINLVYKMIDFPKEVDTENANLETLIPDENERKLYETVKKYVKGKNLTDRELKIRENLLLRKNIDKDIKIYTFNSGDELNIVKSEFKQIGVPEELINQITWNRQVKKYSQQIPNFARTKDGKIVELSKHPDFKMDTSDVIINGGFFYKDLLKIYGLSDEKINQIEKIFEPYQIYKRNSNKQNRRVPTISDKEDSILER